MVIRALVDLYERLLAQGLVAPEGWDTAKISYMVVLNRDGTIKTLVDMRQSVKRGKKDVLIYRPMELPKAVVRTNGKKSNFLWDNSAYVFGYDKDKPDDAELCFRTMRKKHHLVLDGCKGDVAQAILAYFDTHIPGDYMGMYDPLDLNWKENLDTVKEILDGTFNFTFGVDMGDGEVVTASDDPEVKEAWSKYQESLANSDDAVYGVCSVTGREKQKIALVHPKIKGIAGADASGCCLVCYNVRSVCSYGYDGEQAINSFISEYAAMAYAKALNWLLSEPHHHMVFGNETVVYWSKGNKEAYGDCFEKVMNTSVLTGSKEENRDSATGNTETENKGESLYEIMKAVKEGKGFSFDDTLVNPDESFCILGLGSSGARASVRFFLEDSFGSVLTNMYKHQEQMLVERPETISSVPLWLLLKTSVRNGADVPASLVDGVFNSILHDSPYPPSLYINMVHRVLLDSDGTKGAEKAYKLNYVKAGFIKAYLVRNCHDRWKELDTLAVNTDCNKKPYLLGRLFATLEGIQSKALPNINSTIKDRYFNSACQTPGITFPVLLKLSQAHLRKLKKPLAIYFSKLVGDLVDRITIEADETGFPVRLNPEEQGVFMLGYYQERQSVFKKLKDKKDENAVDSESEEN